MHVIAHELFRKIFVRMIKPLLALVPGCFLLLQLSVSAQDVLMRDTTVVSCHAMFYDSGGGQQDYSSGEDFILTFRSESHCILSVDFDNSFILGQGDTLFVFDGCSALAPLLGAYTGNSIQTVIQSTGECLTFRFVSDSPDNGPGWIASVTCPTTPDAVITAVGPTSFCGGDSLLLVASGGVTYQWNIFSTEDSIYVSFPGTYEVTVTGSSGCTDTETVVITVLPLPPVSFIMQDTVCRESDPFSLTGGFPPGGTYDGPGVINGVFDPYPYAGSTIVLTYTYTDTNSCSRTIPKLVFVDRCNGIGSAGVLQPVLVYPNPARNTLVMEGFIGAKHLKIKILNISGRTLLNQEIASVSGPLILDLSGLGSGFYMVQADAERPCVFYFLKE